MADETIGQDAVIAESEHSSILCDGQILNSIIDEFGIQVMIRKIVRTESISDAYDNAVETATDHRTKAVINIFTENDDEVKEGLFKAGLVIAYFKQTDSSWLKPGYEVWYDNKWWEMSNVSPQFTGTYRFFIQVTLRRT